jgi:hypothetical protein
MGGPEDDDAAAAGAGTGAAAEDADESFNHLNDQLARLIADGQRALGAAVVVASESAEDEVDDGLGQWADEDVPGASSYGTGPRTPGGSIRKRRPRSLVRLPGSPGRPVAGSPGSSLSPRKDAFRSGGLAPLTPTRHARGDSNESIRSVKEDTDAWQSAEMRELMQKARQARGL